MQVLWVKGSGGDLRTATDVNFASLYRDKVLALEDIYDQADVRGVKTVGAMNTPTLLIRFNGWSIAPIF